MAGPASATEEQTLIATVDLAEPCRTRNGNEFNHPLRDRRSDVYDAMLGRDLPRGHS